MIVKLNKVRVVVVVVVVVVVGGRYRSLIFRGFNSSDGLKIFRGFNLSCLICKELATWMVHDELFVEIYMSQSEIENFTLASATVAAKAIAASSRAASRLALSAAL